MGKVCFFLTFRVNVEMLFLALLFSIEVNAWTSTSMPGPACTLSTRRRYSSSALYKKCPSAFKCDSGLENGRTKDDYGSCETVECSCPTQEEQIQVQLQIAKHQGKSRVTVFGCYEEFYQLGMSCRYRMPKGCSVETSRCGSVITYVPSDCEPLGSSCVG